ncbi:MULTISPECIES: GTPase [Gammaproteobacteria]|uniref:GTPase n=1 Tax=Gammaproteobacteria TaxID=1236 RepID=UPI0021158EAE|nr:GTPase [Pseudomonas sp. Hp2]
MGSLDLSEQERARRDIAAVLPGRDHDLTRLRVLAEGGIPIVTVIGKYNHGKSRLLNELLGHDAFAVADRRETVALSECERDGVRWLDAPGIDADVGVEDDRHAMQAAWLQSDIRLFVHAAKEGELDAQERALLGELRADAGRTRRKTLFVLSQVDQLADEAELDKVIDALQSQLPDLKPIPVSATRHRLGVQEGKRLMFERSGFPRLRDELATSLSGVQMARAHETALLLGEILAELQALHSRHKAALAESRARQRQQRLAFVQGLEGVFARIGANIRAVVDAPGPDHAQTADSAEDHYRQTAAKLERARIQVAYSRACIELDGFLAGHGVVELPSAQRTGARAMDSVMVAVMGVSVKRRSDLRRMFCDGAGIERLHQDFLHYFELSKDRIELAGAIAVAEAEVATVENALDALHALVPVA